MTSDAERQALQRWLDAFEPAVAVEVTRDDVLIWSTRHNRGGEIVRCGRTSDLQQDLNSALSRLVERMS